MKSVLEKYREHAIECAQNLNEAKLLNDQAHHDFIDLLCNTYKINPDYIGLMEAVIADPLHGAYKFPSNILWDATQKDLIKHVHGGIRTLNIAGVSSNAWYELGDNGKQLMKDYKGPQWNYLHPYQQQSSRVGDGKLDYKPENQAFDADASSLSEGFEP
jgi:hypothetical protein